MIPSRLGEGPYQQSLTAVSPAVDIRSFTGQLFKLRFLVPDAVEQWVKELPFVQDMEWILRNMKSNGFSPDAIIDGGAYEGDWTALVAHIFPEADILMVEPQQEVKNHLQNMSERSSRIHYLDALLAAEGEGSVPFHVRGPVSSVLSASEADSENTESRSATTLDRLIQEQQFPAPDFLKLDVQGYELEVLRGAEHTLERAPPEVIQLEVSLIDCIGGAPLMAEVCEFMDQRDYRVYDICTFYRRPLDDALWQVDVLFVHDASSLVSSTRYE